MRYVAYNYFPPNNIDYIKGIGCALSNTEIKLTHFGKNDPPKKWKGKVSEIIDILQQGTDKTNYTFAKDTTKKLEIDFALGNDSEAVISSISISGESEDLVEQVCLHFAKYVNSYLCISGRLGLGASQSWSFLLESESCPKSILDQVRNA